MLNDRSSDRSEKAIARRDRIVQAARVLFAEHGFHATGMAQISRESGVLVGQIYRDFANKEAIVEAIVELDLGEFLADTELSEARGRCDKAGIRDWIIRFIGGSELEDFRLVAEILAEASRSERIATIFRCVDERLRSQLAQALEILVPGDADDQALERLAETILTMSAGMFHRRLMTPGVDHGPVLRALADCVDRELAALG
jgi:AcrR family transcriptional regulator